MMGRIGIDPASPHNNLPPEIMLVGAVLRQAICDARRDSPSATTDRVQQEAINFLMDDASIAFWANMIGADPEGIAYALRKELEMS